MKNFIKSFVGHFIFVFLLACGLLSTGAEAATCTTIHGGSKSTTTSITAPGSYCLDGNLTYTASTGDAVTISADDVTLDLSGYAIVVTTSNGNGIYLVDNDNVTIRNGTIRGYGIANKGIFIDTLGLGKGVGNIVENMRVMNVTDTGIDLAGTNNIARSNYVANCARGIMLRNGSGGPIDTGSSVVNNDIYNVSVSGMYINAVGGGVVIENNRISNPSPVIAGTVGIDINQTNHLIINNRISYMASGVDFRDNAGQFRDNVTQGCTTGFANALNAHDVGGNSSF